MVNGYFSIVLHAHLPFVRHRENERLEERWLFEAMCETYIPLLWNLEEQHEQKAFTISFSTPLMEMLADPLMQRRFLHSLEKTQSLLKKEENTVKKVEERLLVEFYTRRFEKIRETFLKYEQNLLKGFRNYCEEGKITCICSSATHAFLPYLQTSEGLRAQIVHGIRTFAKYFGFKPKGFWLPECAFNLGLDRILFEEGIRYTFVDEHALKYAEPVPSKGASVPIYSPNGIMLFPRNTRLSNQVWSSYDGYPGDVNYREFYRDIAHERDWDYIQPFMHSEGIRFDSMLKFHRVTGRTEDKHYYLRENALAKVKEHSDHFIKEVKEELQLNESPIKPPYLIVTPFDAELFGHWWFEGPDWLKHLLTDGGKEVEFITPEVFLERHYLDIETAEVTFSTWGRDGYGEVWLNEKNCWIYPKLHCMENDLVQLVTEFKGKSAETDRGLKQLVREWMLAVSSDWPFILDSESATQYAINRLLEHMNRYEQLRSSLVNMQLNHNLLSEYEAEYPFLAEIILDIFVKSQGNNAFKQKIAKQLNLRKKTILMLAWEYPPMIVGGLSRHVFDLTKALANEDCEVHVITTAVTGSPDYEMINDVHIHRVTSLQPEANDFYDWVGSFNLAICDYVLDLSKKVQFDLIHAHDWLVSVATISLKEQLKIPVVATIHATEHGRNNGIYTELQQNISQKEWQLTYEASMVIVCSHYMKDEVINIFQLPLDKIAIIPNGVDREMVIGNASSSWKLTYGSENDIYIFSVGRIVKEKGFQTIIDAAPMIISRHSNVKFIIAGKGPLLEDYRSQVIEKKLEKHVYFIGFVEDHQRNEIFQGCDICLFPSYYEPFGIVALEGMIVGKPTIVSDTGGLGEIITHEKTGVTIYPQDVQSLTNQVINLIENQELAKELLEMVKSSPRANIVGVPFPKKQSLFMKSVYPLWK
ncbi:1,4-alpha-glucan branching protein domain-containing protein [Anaerobacillus sp. CMMVII]|uniref:1,4-alpha-glucan branching protein domain-containing protein n=1 Tax=Anaerobacillus sp. CMMVII TaxID=2755588 RepID=UPI0021B6F94B|nr:1,4-alpha-glucan branching protein domain-containing protein [Anaerobacillus sp. CMMVII]